MSILKMGQAQKYRDEATDGQGGSSSGGASGSGDVKDYANDPVVQKMIQEALDREVAGLKKKNSELIGAEKKYKEQMAQFEGLDVEHLKNLQKQMQENEEMRLLAEGKTEEVVARRVELLKKDYEAQLAARDGKLQEYEGTLKQKEENLRKLLVDGTIREAYVGLDFEPTAMADTLRNARDVFIMDPETGKVVPRDEHGNIIFSKDGKTPIDAKGWLEMQAERKPYLKRPSKGSGAGGNNGYGKSNLEGGTSTSKIARGLEAQGFRM